MSTFGRRVIDRVSEEVKDFNVDSTLEGNDAIFQTLDTTTATIDTLTAPDIFTTNFSAINITGVSNLCISSSTGASLAGNIHLDASNNRLYVYTGSSWKSTILF